MPRIPRNPGSGKPPHNGPAMGRAVTGPASKNRVIAPMATPFAPGTSGNPSGGPGYRAIAKAERVAKLNERLWDWSMNDVIPVRDAQNAVIALLNREDGMPVQKVVTADVGQQWYIEGVAKEVSSEAWERTAQLSIAKPEGSAD